MTQRPTRLLVLTAVLALTVVVALAFRPKALVVATGPVTRGLFTATLTAEGRARSTRVIPERFDADRTVIASGLSEGDTVIAQPADAISDGARIAQAAAQ